MPLNPATGLFQRIWKFVDYKQPRSIIYRADLDVALDDLASGIQLNKLNTPIAFGAVGDGVADDRVAVQAWINAAVAAQTGTGYSRSTIVLNFGSARYGISAPGLVIPATSNLAAYNPNLIAIGTGWNIGNCLLTNNANFANFYSAIIQCNRKSNGVADTGFRTRWFSPYILNFSSDFASYGYYKPSGSEAGLLHPHIRQYNIDEAPNQAALTGDCVWITQSDCFVIGGSLGWARTCYRGAVGIHELKGIHFNGAQTNTPYTDPIGIEFGQDGGGNIKVTDCYLDNVICNFANTSAVTFDGVKGHYNPAKSIFADGAIRFKATGTDTEPKFKGDMTFTMPMTNITLLSFYDAGGSTWPAVVKAVATATNNKIKSVDSGTVSFIFGNETVRASWNVANPYETVYAPPGSYLNLSQFEGVIRMVHLSAEPVRVGAGYIALSDGTASTNGFGILGEGVYVKDASLTWQKLFSSINGGVAISLTTTPLILHTASAAGRVIDVKVVAANNSGFVMCQMLGGTTAVIVPGSVVSYGTAITLSVSGSSIRAAVAGTMTANYSAVRVI